jgi:hypothetical protein
MLIISVLFVFMGFFVLAHWPSEFSSTLAATSNTNWSLPQPDRSGRGSYPSTIDCKIGGAGAEVRTHAPCRGPYHEKTDRRFQANQNPGQDPCTLQGSLPRENRSEISKLTKIQVRTHAPCRGSYHEKTDRRILSYLTSRSGPMHLAGGPTTRKPIADF